MEYTVLILYGLVGIVGGGGCGDFRGSVALRCGGKKPFFVVLPAVSVSSFPHLTHSLVTLVRVGEGAFSRIFFLLRRRMFDVRVGMRSCSRFLST